MVKTIVFLNSLLFACLVAIGAYEACRILLSDQIPTEIKLFAVFVRAVVVLPLALCIFGLVRRTHWGADAAFVADLGLAILIGAMPFAGYVIIVLTLGDGAGAHFSIAPMRGLVIAGMCLAMAIAVRRGRVRKYFAAVT